MSEPASDRDLVFHLEPQGNLGNQMMQYMTALKFTSLVPGCRISNVHLPLWGIDHPAIWTTGPTALQRAQQHFNFAVADAMNEGTINRVHWTGYGQRMENFLPRASYEPVFKPPAESNARFGREHLVCPVRAGDVLHGEAWDYPLTPVEFYVELVERTGLRPVFVGQTALNAYTLRLRERFPNADFLESEGPMRDFDLIRQSSNIAVSVSTFSWLAAWLSHAENIFMPVSGLLNPMQAIRNDLLPLGDSRYHFWLFPLNYGVPLAEHAAAHRRIAPYWRLVTHDMLRRHHAAAPRVERRLEPLLAAFDEAYYLSNYSDVVDSIQAGIFAGGREHYIGHGFAERRLPFPLDRRWYAAQYPVAAMEVAQGDYADFAHHYVVVGKARGYRPLPG